MDKKEDNYCGNPDYYNRDYVKPPVKKERVVLGRYNSYAELNAAWDEEGKTVSKPVKKLENNTHGFPTKHERFDKLNEVIDRYNELEAKYNKLVELLEIRVGGI